MTRTRSALLSFASGEIDPLLHQRTDFIRHKTGLALCRGFLPMRQGGFTRAPGTLFRGRTKDDAVAVQVPFVFATDDAVRLEFTPGVMRVWRYGVLVTDAEGAPYELETPFDAESLTRLNWAQDADVLYLLDGIQPMQQLSRFALDDWAIGPAALDRGPFGVQNLDAAKTVQAVNIDLGSPPSWQADEALAIGDRRKAGTRIYEFRGVGEEAASAEAGGCGHEQPRHLSGTRGYAVEEPDPGGTEPPQAWWLYLGATEGGAGAILRLVGQGSPFAGWAVGTLLLLEAADATTVALWVGNITRNVGSLLRFDGHIYEVLSRSASAAEVNTGVNPPTHTAGTVMTDPAQGVLYRHVSTEAGIVELTAVTSDNLAEARVVQAVPQPVFDDPTYRWSPSAWTTAEGHPQFVTLHDDQRLYAAGVQTAPRTLYASTQGAYRDFMPSAEDDAAFAYDIGGVGSRNAICWLISGRRGVYIGTLGEVRLGHAGGSDTITPLTFRPETVSQIGAAGALPVLPFGWPVYIARDRRRLIEVRYNFSQDSMTPVELSLPAQHLGARGFRQIVWQSSPEQRGWICCDDGSLLCLTYDPEQDVLGWAVVPLAGGRVENMAITPSATGGEDILTLVVCRTIDGAEVRCVEDMASNVGALTGGTELANHAYCGMAHHGAARSVFDLPHLAGQVVSAWTDAGAFEDLEVGPEGTVTLPVEVEHAVIGLAAADHVARLLSIQAAAPIGDTRGFRLQIQSGSTIMLHRTGGGLVRLVWSDDGRSVEGDVQELAPPAFDAVQAPEITGPVPIHLCSPAAHEVTFQIEARGVAPLTVLGVVPAIDEKGA